MKKGLQTLNRNLPHGVPCWLQPEDKLDVANNSSKREWDVKDSEVISNNN